MLNKIILIMLLVLNISLFASDDTKIKNFIFKPISESKETKLKEYFDINENNSWMYKYMQISNNKYLYTNDGPAIGAGLYYLNLATKEDKRLLPGYGNDIKFLQQKNKTILQFTNKVHFGRRGSGYMEFYIFDINFKNGEFSKKKVLDYEYDMESGLCGRAFLGFKFTGKINNYIIENKGDNIFIKFNVTEQNCTTKSITKKVIDIEID